MKSLILSLRSHEEAALVYQELVSNNKELLETKIGEADVAIFIDLIRSQGPKAEYLKFLTAICACQGEPLVRNQELMLKVMYSASLKSDSHEKNRYKLLIETMVDPRDLESLAFDRPFKPTYTNPPTNTRAVMGGRIIEDGFRTLLMGWYGSDVWTESFDETAFYYGPGTLGIEQVDITDDLLPGDLHKYHDRVNLKEPKKKFQWVRVRDVLWTLQPDVMKRRTGSSGEPSEEGWTDYQKQMAENPKKREQFERTKELAEYYVAQIDLYATMCYDRSYNCMGYLQKQFSYEVVVTAVADTALPDPARSAFARLLYMLYVDRYPQETLRVPNLVRPESEVKAMNLKDEDSLPRFRYIKENAREKSSSSSTSSVDLDGAGAADEEATASPTKFYILQETIAEHVDVKLKGRTVLSLKELNILTLQMLQCLEKLFYSGFYSTYEQMQSFVKSGVKLLDGRNDVDGLSELLKEGIHFMDRRATHDVVTHGRGTVLSKPTVVVVDKRDGVGGGGGGAKGFWGIRSESSSKEQAGKETEKGPSSILKAGDKRNR